MTTPDPILLLTRPEPQARDFAHVLAGQLDPPPKTEISPLIAITPLTVSVDLTGVEVMILTSANAVQLAGDAVRRFQGRIYCVGAMTGAAVRALGQTVEGMAPTGAALMDLLEQLPKASAVHLAGVQVQVDFAALLTVRGWHARHIGLYDQQPRALSDRAKRVLVQSPVIAPIFSTHAATVFCDALAGIDLFQLHLLAISPTVSQALEDMLQPLSNVRVTNSETPDRAGMIAAIRSVYLAKA